MTEPIKPQNILKLGGVEFEANDTNSYGETIGKDGLSAFFIDFKNGVKIVYPQQKNKITIWNSEEQKEQTGEPKAGMSNISNITGAIIELKNNAWTLLQGLKNCDIKNASALDLYDSEDCNLTGTDGHDYICVSRSNNINIDTGEGCDFISLDDSDNAVVDSGSGDDGIFIDDSKNFEVETGNGEDDVFVSVKSFSETGFYGTRVMSDSLIEPDNFVELAPDGKADLSGKVKLEKEDTLTISKRVVDVNYSDFEYQYDEETHDFVPIVKETTNYTEGKIIVKGEGVHNMEQTPQDKFETKKYSEERTEKEQL